ncbi:MAG: DNA-protecting protein DprA [Alphaproteobacteria bacterium]|nr:DNA-protecting protein DprA [Alphaproteobacteria bacterium]
MATLRLIRTENVGPVAFFDLLRRYGSASKALITVSHHAQKGGLKRPLCLASEESVAQEYHATLAHGARFLFHDDPLYPRLLRTIHDPPPVLTYKGNIALAKRPCVGVVGARNASLNAKKFAKILAAELSAEGYTVVSGLARGIDTAAHEGALDQATIACVAGGIDKIYPPENQALHAAITQKGLILTESPLGTEPQGGLFPRRNRLISGLSTGVIVVEAALRSGSLITAKFALDQGREVFAVPGFPLDPRAGGTNQLIQRGAHLLQRVGDVIDVLGSILFASPLSNPLDAPQNVEENTSLSPEEAAHMQEKILSFLSATPICIDELRRECHISSSSFSLLLLELELAGRVVRAPGNQVCLRLEDAP